MNPDVPGVRALSLKPVTAACLAGVIAGSIDIGAACLISGKGVTYILHFIAGGVLAAQSFSGGLPTALLGLALQELMGVLIAAMYIGALRFIPWLRARWIPAGIGYGLVIYGVMNYLVMPLSAWHTAPTFRWRSFLLDVAAMWLFGVIVAFFGSRTQFAGRDQWGSKADPRLAASA